MVKKTIPDYGFEKEKKIKEKERKEKKKKLAETLYVNICINQVSLQIYDR